MPHRVLVSLLFAEVADQAIGASNFSLIGRELDVRSGFAAVELVFT